MPEDYLIIQGARQNNLKNINLRIPHNEVTVITGVSGSGKSSLAFDTIFAEGQWRYIESLSTYARLFLEKVNRPDIDAIENIRPAIAIEQKNPVKTSRSTVGTATEIYDYLRLLFTKIGKTFCPTCENEVKSYNPHSVTDEIISRYAGKSILIMFPLFPGNEGFTEETASDLVKRGFIRLKYENVIYHLGDGQRPHLKKGASTFNVIVDRLMVSEDRRARFVDSIETSFREGRGLVTIEIIGEGNIDYGEGFRCYRCMAEFSKPQPLLFSFNHPLGACPECKGFGNVLRYDEDLIIPDKSLSLQQGAIEPMRMPAYRWWQNQLIKGAKNHGIDTKKPYEQLTEEERLLISKGAEDFYGIKEFLEHLEGKRYKMYIRIFLSRYRSPFPCSSCKGTRLNDRALYVRIGGLSIAEVSRFTIKQFTSWFEGLRLTSHEEEISHEILKQIRKKIMLMDRIGLYYLTLDRMTKTLSGGEAQRINIVNQLGAALTGTLYVLDEPSIGLHARDTGMLAGIVRDIAKEDNTVVIVEHDSTMIKAAGYVVELGPKGGKNGGRLMYAGDINSFISNSNTLTARYLNREISIPIPKKKRRGERSLYIIGAAENNLKHIDVRIPLQTFTCVTGVSGSGKSTLMEDIIFKALGRHFKTSTEKTGRFERIIGTEHIKGVKFIDQSPIGKTPRANPVTYVKAFDEIRKMFANLPEAKKKDLKPFHFSFNTIGGRCEECQGSGHKKLEMYFFEDMYITCEQCEGKRYRPEILRIKYNGKNISDILNMTVEETLDFFRLYPSITNKLQIMHAVGLGYLRIGQAINTLSGGESQRLKLCAELRNTSVRDYIYLMDEPTTGLHPDDIVRLLKIIDYIVEAGNTVIVVEHNLDVIKCADYVIDLGPEGGNKGGWIVAEGTPEEIIKVDGSYTGLYLKEHLSRTSYTTPQQAVGLQ
ncbi:MAG: excinuclease ABC subunit UvrA [Nitrospirota bacterium]